MDDHDAALAFSSLGHSKRVAVLRLLVRAGAAGLNVSTLRDRLGEAPSTFAHHLKALADAGLVVQERVGREVVSRADYCAIRRLGGFLMEDCCRDAFLTPPLEARQGHNA